MAIEIVDLPIEHGGSFHSVKVFPGRVSCHFCGALAAQHRGKHDVGDSLVDLIDMSHLQPLYLPSGY